jgi:DNA-directed RNA polymerase specialized sigma24 family protein
MYQRRFDEVYGYLRLMLADSAEAEKATTEVFLRAYQSAELRSPSADERPRLLSIARAVVLAIGCSRDGALGDGSSDPHLAAAVRRLPEIERDSVVLLHVLGLSVRDVATVLGRTQLRVRRAQRRGLRALERSIARSPLGGPAALLAGVVPG